MKKQIFASILLAVMTASVITGCGTTTESSSTADTTKAASSSTADSAIEKKIKILSIWAEDTDNGKLLTDLTNNYIKDENPNFSYDYELVSSDNLAQKIATLVASSDLPDVFVYESGTPLKALIEADKVLDVGSALEDIGAMDKLEDGAVSLLKSLSGTDKLYDLPLGLNVEGFWYNKALFTEAKVEVPKTWDELLAACDKLMAADIQPLTAGGADKWPLTRLVNAYAFRSMGKDAMDKAASGEISYTDKGLVASAQMIADMAAKDYFGKGVTTVDQTTAGDMLLSGKAAMFYNGSWFTENLVADTNPAGEDGIGFFSVPVVNESVSKITEYPMNCGNILCLDKEKYDEGTAGWLGYIVSNLGDYAMKEFGAVKGYKYDASGELGTYSQMVADALGEVTASTKWWEASMKSETKASAQDNVQTLVNGDMTAEEYMKSIQSAYESSK